MYKIRCTAPETWYEISISHMGLNMGPETRIPVSTMLKAASFVTELLSIVNPDVQLYTSYHIYG